MFVTHTDIHAMKHGNHTNVFQSTQELMAEKLSEMRPMEEYPFIESLMIEPTGSTKVEDPSDKQERELVLFVLFPHLFSRRAQPFTPKHKQREAGS